jgi:hypothetical protein
MNRTDEAFILSFLFLVLGGYYVWFVSRRTLYFDYVVMFLWVVDIFVFLVLLVIELLDLIGPKDNDRELRAFRQK